MTSSAGPTPHIQQGNLVVCVGCFAFMGLGNKNQEESLE